MKIQLLENKFTSKFFMKNMIHHGCFKLSYGLIHGIHTVYKVCFNLTSIIYYCHQSYLLLLYVFFQQLYSLLYLTVTFSSCYSISKQILLVWVYFYCLKSICIRSGF